MNKPRLCHVCERPADFEVILYDVYLETRDVFFERDFTCPFLCTDHMIENERQAQGERLPRGGMEYPYSNQHQAQGFTIYRPI